MEVFEGGGVEDGRDEPLALPEHDVFRAALEGEADAGECVEEGGTRGEVFPLRK
jgi:hypothetical protein